MRLLMIQARVQLAADGQAPSAVAWDTPAASPRRGAGSLSPTRRVVSVIDRWRYDGRWWEARELHRDYFLLELDGGAQLELFLEGGVWWAARASD